MNTISSPTINHKESWRDIAFDLSGRFPIARWAAPVPFGGLAILLGAFVTLVSLPMAALLLVAIFTVHLPYGFSSIKLMAVTATGAQFGPVGYECNLLYLACLLALVLGGPGPLAIDGFLRKWRRVGHS